MTRIRIIIPAATIERTRLYLARGVTLLLCVLIFPLAAHGSPFDSGISSIQTLFTGTIAKAASLIAMWSAATHSRTENRARRRRLSALLPEPG